MIKDLNELKKFLKLCRAEGVESIKFGEVEVHLGHMPTKETRARRVVPETLLTPTTYTPGGITADTKIMTDELTEEQKMFWSTGENQ